MPIQSLSVSNVAVVFLFAKDLVIERLSLDVLKSWGISEINSTGEAILMRDVKSGAVIKLQPRRLEFELGGPTIFGPDDLAAFCTKFLDRIDNKEFAAVGTNYSGRFIVPEIPDAGAWLRDKFLLDRKPLEENVGAPIFSASTRLFFGEPKKYSDLRLAMINIGHPDFFFHLHLHEQLAGSDKTVDITGIGSRLKAETDMPSGIISKVMNVS